MIPPYITNRKEKNEQPQQIQLEIPDYSAEYYEWLRQKEQEKKDQERETVIIIDI